MLCVPPPNIFQSLVDRPLPNRPLEFFLDYIHEAGIGDHLFEYWGNDDVFPELFTGFNSKFTTLVKDVVGSNGVVIGCEDRIDLGVLKVTSRSKVTID